ncbi:MAG: carbohydrate-binding protein [Gammaproteobacteria bacterium]|nr:MAG: carbohydrate-binding protein [Gammaproteobacteria bacterium]
MYKTNISSHQCSKMIKKAFCFLSASFVLAAISQTSSASCTYTVDSEWATGFTASITIKNDTSSPINNWNVNWKYTTNRMSGGWNANFSGTNPYTATNLSWNSNIAVGQTVSFGLQGEKNGGAAERPTVDGTGCSGGTTSSASSVGSSAIPVSSSSRSNSSTPSALLIEESQAGFCRVDGTIDNNHEGFNGTGFANTNNVQGAAVVWAVESSNSGRQTLTFRYANGGIANRNGSLIINGGSNGNYMLSLPVTGSWTSWQTVAIEVDLVQGNNILQLSSVTAEGLPNIDSLTLVGGTVKAGNCGGVSTSSSSKSSSSSSVPANPNMSLGCGKTRSLQNGLINLRVGNLNRSYMLRAPDNYNPNTPYRLVLGYHWRGGDASQVANGGNGAATETPYYGLWNLAKNSTIFIAPEGLDKGWANSGGQDITFTDAILNQVQGDLCIDKSRIFATGFSFGAGMSNAIACARANVFRAVALYSGAQLSGCSGGTAPVPFFATHGIDDNVLGISLGRGVRDRFVKNNKCAVQNPLEPARGSGTHICTSYQSCTQGYPVRWCAFDGGHWPSQHDAGKADSWIPGEAWSFITQF